MSDKFASLMARLAKSVVNEGGLPGLYHYTIDSQMPLTPFTILEATPIDQSLPKIFDVEARGINGITGTYAPGTKCIIAFEDADPAKPFFLVAEGFPTLNSVNGGV